MIYRTTALFAVVPLLGSCSGVQSSLDPGGEEAAQVATLFWVMIAGGTLIWIFVVVLLLYASRWQRSSITDRTANQFILWGGVAFPVSILTALLTYALWMMPSLRPFANDDPATLRIEITGSQFWWHVVYHPSQGPPVISANEVRLPVGERVEFILSSTDMIHSFWIPSLGGKMDLIPGRTNRLSLQAIKAGIYRGQCAEFCGTSHALMAFPVIAMAPLDFRQWLDARTEPSQGIVQNSAGRELFLREDCANCHRIRGTQAMGTGGPDLSHVGSRLTIGAGLLENDADMLSRFIIDSASVKPGSHMPSYTKFSGEEAGAIAHWLKGLQ